MPFDEQAPAFVPIDECTTVRELLADPDRWTKGRAWEGPDGEACDLEGAARFCLIGASAKVYGRDDRRYGTLPIGRAILQVSRIAAVDIWNDHPDTTHEDVLRVLEIAGV